MGNLEKTDRQSVHCKFFILLPATLFIIFFSVFTSVQRGAVIVLADCLCNVLDTQTGQWGRVGGLNCSWLAVFCGWWCLAARSAQGEAGAGLTGTGSRWVGAVTEAERAWLLDNVRSQATFGPSTHDDITVISPKKDVGPTLWVTLLVIWEGMWCKKSKHNIFA